MGARRQRLALRRRAGRDGSARGDQDDYTACVLGLRDYVEKNGFKGVVLGLSGGIDSALARPWRSMRSGPSACAA